MRCLNSLPIQEDGNRKFKFKIHFMKIKLDLYLLTKLFCLTLNIKSVPKYLYD